MKAKRLVALLVCAAMVVGNFTGTQTIARGTQTEDERTLSCGKEEHVHGGDCYLETTHLTCEEEHEHTETCYESGVSLVCAFEEHTHTDSCYTVVSVPGSAGAEDDSSDSSVTDDSSDINTESASETPDPEAEGADSSSVETPEGGESAVPSQENTAGAEPVREKPAIDESLAEGLDFSSCRLVVVSKNMTTELPEAEYSLMSGYVPHKEGFSSVLLLQLPTPDEARRVFLELRAAEVTVSPDISFYEVANDTVVEGETRHLSEHVYWGAGMDPISLLKARLAELKRQEEARKAAEEAKAQTGAETEQETETETEKEKETETEKEKEKQIVAVIGPYIEEPQEEAQEAAQETAQKATQEAAQEEAKEASVISPEGTVPGELPEETKSLREIYQEAVWSFLPEAEVVYLTAAQKDEPVTLSGVYATLVLAAEQGAEAAVLPFGAIAEKEDPVLESIISEARSAGLVLVAPARPESQAEKILLPAQVQGVVGIHAWQAKGRTGAEEGASSEEAAQNTTEDVTPPAFELVVTERGLEATMPAETPGIAAAKTAGLLVSRGIGASDIAALLQQGAAPSGEESGETKEGETPASGENPSGPQPADEVKNPEEKEPSESTSAEAAPVPAAPVEGTPEADGQEETTEVSEEMAPASLNEADYALGELVLSESDYTITIKYGEDALIPEGSTVGAKEILPGTEGYEFYRKNAAVSMYGGDGEIPFARFFDITIYSPEGTVVQPSAPVLVQIDLFDGGLSMEGVDFSVLHFVSEKTSSVEAAVVTENPEVIQKKASAKKAKPLQAPPFEAPQIEKTEIVPAEKVSDEAQQALPEGIIAGSYQEEAPARGLRFAAGGFSVYGVVAYYTVDFYYEVFSDGSEEGYYLEHHMAGGSEMMLSELFRIFEIGKAASDIVELSFSDESLVRFEKEGSDYRIISLRPFTTTEELLLRFTDGSEVFMIVRDAVAPTVMGSTNITWEITDDGELKIYPTTGDTATMVLSPGNSQANWWPWYQYRNSITKVTVTGDIKMQGYEKRYMFAYMPNLVEADLRGLDFSGVSMALNDMFSGDAKLTSIQFRSIPSGQNLIAQINRLFKDCSSLETVDLSWLGKMERTASIQANDIFSGATSLKTVNFTGVDTSSSSSSVNFGLGGNQTVQTILASNSKVHFGGFPSGKWKVLLDGTDRAEILTQSQMQTLISTGTVTADSGKTLTNSNGTGYLPPGIYVKHVEGGSGSGSSGEPDPSTMAGFTSLPQTFYLLDNLTKAPYSIEGIDFNKFRVFYDKTEVTSEAELTAARLANPDGEIDIYTKALTHTEWIAQGSTHNYFKTSSGVDPIRLRYEDAVTDVNGKKHDLVVTINQVDFMNVTSLSVANNDTTPGIANVSGSKKKPNSNGYAHFLFQIKPGILTYANYIVNRTTHLDVPGAIGTWGDAVTCYTNSYASTYIDYTLIVPDSEPGSSILVFVDDIDVASSTPAGVDVYNEGAEGIIIGGGNDLSTVTFSSDTILKRWKGTTPGTFVVVSNDDVTGNYITGSRKDSGTNEPRSRFYISASATGASYRWTSGTSCNTTILQPTSAAGSFPGLAPVRMNPIVHKILDGEKPESSDSGKFTFELKYDSTSTGVNPVSASDEPTLYAQTKTNEEDLVTFDTMTFYHPGTEQLTNQYIIGTYVYEIKESAEDSGVNDDPMVDYDKTKHYLKVVLYNPENDAEMRQGFKAVVTTGTKGENDTAITWSSVSQTIWSTDVEAAMESVTSGGNTYSIYTDFYGVKYYYDGTNYYSPQHVQLTVSESSFYPSIPQRKDNSKSETVKVGGTEYRVYVDMHGQRYYTTGTACYDADTRVLLTPSPGTFFPAVTDESAGYQTVTVNGNVFRVYIEENGKSYYAMGKKFYDPETNAELSVQPGVFYPAAYQDISQKTVVDPDGIFDVYTDANGTEYYIKNGKYYDPVTGNRLKPSEAVMIPVTVTANEYPLKRDVSGVVYYKDNSTPPRYFAEDGTELTPYGGQVKPSNDDATVMENRTVTDGGVAYDLRTEVHGIEYYVKAGSYYLEDGTKIDVENTVFNPMTTDKFVQIPRQVEYGGTTHVVKKDEKGTLYYEEGGKYYDPSTHAELTVWGGDVTPSDSDEDVLTNKVYSETVTEDMTGQNLPVYRDVNRNKYYKVETSPGSGTYTYHAMNGDLLTAGVEGFSPAAADEIVTNDYLIFTDENGVEYYRKDGVYYRFTATKPHPAHHLPSTTVDAAGVVSAGTFYNAHKTADLTIIKRTRENKKGTFRFRVHFHSDYTPEIAMFSDPHSISKDVTVGGVLIPGVTMDGISKLPGTSGNAVSVAQSDIMSGGVKIGTSTVYSFTQTGSAVYGNYHGTQTESGGVKEYFFSYYEAPELRSIMIRQNTATNAREVYLDGETTPAVVSDFVFMDDPSLSSYGGTFRFGSATYTFNAASLTIENAPISHTLEIREKTEDESLVTEIYVDGVLSPGAQSSYDPAAKEGSVVLASGDRYDLTSSAVMITENIYEFTLEENQRVVMKDLPSGCVFDIYEYDHLNGWYLVDIDAKNSGDIVSRIDANLNTLYEGVHAVVSSIDPDDYTYTFTNQFTEISVRKIVTGNLANVTEVFSFEVVFSGLTPGERYSYATETEEATDGNTIIFTDDVADENGIIRSTFKLAHKEMQFIVAPYGAVMTITENMTAEQLKEGFVTYITVDGKNRIKDTVISIVNPEDDKVVEYENRSHAAIPTEVRFGFLASLLVLPVGLSALILMYVMRRRRERLEEE